MTRCPVRILRGICPIMYGRTLREGNQMTTQQPPRPAPDPSESLPVVRLLPRPVRIGTEYEPLLGLTIEYEREGPRWIADVPELPGVMVYGQTRKDAREAVLRLATAVIRDRENSIPPDAA